MLVDPGGRWRGSCGESGRTWATVRMQRSRRPVALPTKAGSFEVIASAPGRRRRRMGSYGKEGSPRTHHLAALFRCVTVSRARHARPVRGWYRNFELHMHCPQSLLDVLRRRLFSDPLRGGIVIHFYFLIGTTKKRSPSDLCFIFLVFLPAGHRHAGAVHEPDCLSDRRDPGTPTERSIRLARMSWWNSEVDDSRTRRAVGGALYTL